MRYAITALIAAILCLVLCLVWFSWKLFVILMLFGWMMNLENKGN